MPKVEAGETRDHYMERCMVYPDLQSHEEGVRRAICEHLYDRESKEEGTPGEHKDDRSEATLPLIGDVRFEGDGIFRYESAVPDAGRKVNIDRPNNLMIGVRGMNAKPTRKDYYYGLNAQKAVVSRYEGMVVGLNHDYKQGPPIIERSLGKVVKAYTDDNGTLFDIQYNPAHERMEQILKDAETGLNTISPSCITTKCEQHGNEVTSFLPAGVDFVVNAGQTTKMFEQAAAAVAAPIADPRLEQAFAEIAALKAKVAKIETTAPATVAADVKRMEQALTKRGVDLDSFHADFLKSQK